MINQLKFKQAQETARDSGKERKLVLPRVQLQVQQAAPCLVYLYKTKTCYVEKGNLSLLPAANHQIEIGGSPKATGGS